MSDNTKSPYVQTEKINKSTKTVSSPAPTQVSSSKPTSVVNTPNSATPTVTGYTSSGMPKWSSDKATGSAQIKSSTTMPGYSSITSQQATAAAYQAPEGGYTPVAPASSVQGPEYVLAGTPYVAEQKAVQPSKLDLSPVISSASMAGEVASKEAKIIAAGSAAAALMAFAPYTGLVTAETLIKGGTVAVAASEASKGIGQAALLLQPKKEAEILATIGATRQLRPSPDIIFNLGVESEYAKSFASADTARGGILSNAFQGNLLGSASSLAQSIAPYSFLDTESKTFKQTAKEQAISRGRTEEQAESYALALTQYRNVRATGQILALSGGVIIGKGALPAISGASELAGGKGAAIAFLKSGAVVTTPTQAFVKSAVTAAPSLSAAGAAESILTYGIQQKTKGYGIHPSEVAEASLWGYGLTPIIGGPIVGGSAASAFKSSTSKAVASRAAKLEKVGSVTYREATRLWVDPFEKRGDIFGTKVRKLQNIPEAGLLKIPGRKDAYTLGVTQPGRGVRTRVGVFVPSQSPSSSVTKSFSPSVISTNVPSVVSTKTNTLVSVKSNIPSLTSSFVPTTTPSTVPSLIPTPSTVPSKTTSPINILSTITTPSTIPSTVPSTVPSTISTLITTPTIQPRSFIPKIPLGGGGGLGKSFSFGRRTAQVYKPSIAGIFIGKRIKGAPSTTSTLGGFGIRPIAV